MKRPALNPITGDEIKTKLSTAYIDNYDRIFRKEKLMDEVRKQVGFPIIETTQVFKDTEALESI